METKTVDDTLELSIEERLYSESIIYKCFYWYTSDFDVTISLDYNTARYIVRLKSKVQQPIPVEVLQKIERDLIDFKLRDIVLKETQGVRELIIAKAFAYYDTETEPHSNVSDPVGFSPNDVDKIS